MTTDEAVDILQDLTNDFAFSVHEEEIDKAEAILMGIDALRELKWHTA